MSNIDLSAAAHMRFYIAEDGKERFFQRIDQYTTRDVEATDELREKHAELYLAFIDQTKLVQIDVNELQALKDRVAELEEGIAKRDESIAELEAASQPPTQSSEPDEPPADDEPKQARTRAKKAAA